MTKYRVNGILQLNGCVEVDAETKEEAIQAALNYYTFSREEDPPTKVWSLTAFNVCHPLQVVGIEEAERPDEQVEPKEPE